MKMKSRGVNGGGVRMCENVSVNLCVKSSFAWHLALACVMCVRLQINPGEVEALLSRLPCTFRQELTGVGASLEKRWNFCGFQGIKST